MVHGRASRMPWPQTEDDRLTAQVAPAPRWADDREQSLTLTTRRLPVRSGVPIGHGLGVPVLSSQRSTGRLPLPGSIECDERLRSQAVGHAVRASRTRRRPAVRRSRGRGSLIDLHVRRPSAQTALPDHLADGEPAHVETAQVPPARPCRTRPIVTGPERAPPTARRELASRHAAVAGVAAATR